MNHMVPDFHELEDDFAIPAAGRPRKTTMNEDEIMELMWQNGPVVVQKSAIRTPFVGGDAAAEQAVVREIRGSAAEEGQHLFMQEDEMASWLQYPIEDSSFTRDLYADDLFYTAPITSAAPPTSNAEIRPQPAAPRPPPAQRSGASNSPRVHTFGHFSRLPSRQASKPLVATVRESTVVESNVTPMVAAAELAPETGVSRNRRQAYTVNGGNAAARGELGGVIPCELTVTSSLDGSGASFSATAEPSPTNEKPEAAEDRKRKGREDDDNECQSEDVGYEAVEAKKQSRGSTSTKRSRAAEVHNLSERRRRDRINEKMKALQELIPRCNKSDKASMLDEAIEYMKSLQMQLQMMSMGCGMVPMMYPGMQQYMPAMVMGMGMNPPIMPYPPSMIPGPPMRNPANMGPRFPMPPGFHLPQAHLPDNNNNSRVEASNSSNPTLNSLAGHNTNQPQPQNFVDPYQQQFLGLHQPQSPFPQNQGGVQLTAKQNTNKEDGYPENKQSGRKGL